MKDKIDLRKKAEKKIGGRGKVRAAPPLSGEEAQHLIQELEIHQVELEMQNLELQTAQIASETSRQRYAELYDFAPIGYFTFDRYGLILEANLTGAGQLDRQRSRLIKKPFIVFVAPEDHAAFGLYLLRLFDQKKEERIELKINKKESFFEAQLDSRLIKNAEGEWVCQTAVSDITARKRAEREIKELYTALEKRTAALEKANLDLQARTDEAVEASRLKSQFVANVSHELRTPLNAILGYSQLFLDNTYGMVTPAQAFPLSRIVKNAEELRNLVDHLLELSRIEAGTLSLEIHPVDLSSLINKLASDMKPALTEKGLSLTLNIQKELSWIYSDAGKIEQILTNLLSNAIKFTLQGGITLSAVEREGGEGVDLTVADTGIGIREEQRAHIFQAFHQVDGTETREFGGLGLGLAIVKELTQRLKGEVQVQSEYGAGSTFALFLPRRI